MDLRADRALPPPASSALHTKRFVFRDYSRLLALLLMLLEMETLTTNKCLSICSLISLLTAQIEQEH